MKNFFLGYFVFVIPMSILVLSKASHPTAWGVIFMMLTLSLTWVMLFYASRSAPLDEAAKKFLFKT